MQRFNKAVALLLCLTLLLGILPVSTLAADGTTGQVVDAAIIFADLHTSSGDYRENTLKGILNGIKNAGVNPSSVTSAGDAFSVNADDSKYTGNTSTLTGYIQDVFPDVPVNYVWSDHDRCALQEDDVTLLSNDSGLVYGAGTDGQYGTDDDANYYIFSLSMADLSTYNRYGADFHTNEEVTQAIAAFTEAVEGLKKDRPLFIASHQPLLDRRNDNGHAYEWATAINAAAEKMDVAFFFGHNHYYDVAVDYYYAKGETMSVCSDSNGGAIDVSLNFTHICAGYMVPHTTSSTTRQGVAVAITIYDDAINYTTYDANGVYTGNYALNETVTRSFAASAPEETVPETTAPETSEPESSEPESTEPESSEPESTEPESSEPESTEPESSEPESSEPANENPETGESIFQDVTVGDTTYEEKTVYVLVDEPVAGEKYLIANIDVTGNIIYGNDSEPKEVPGRVIVRNNTSVTYADVEVKEGTIKTADTTYADAKYIELDNVGAVWTVGSGLSLENGSYYLNRSSTNLSLSNSASTSWTYSKDEDRLTTIDDSKTYYVYHTYYTSTWKLTTSNGANEDSTRDIFFYKEVPAQIFTGDQVTYSMQASSLDHVLTEGATTAKLSYVLLTDGAEADLPSGGSYKFEVVNDTAGIISGVSGDGTVTFTGNEGTCYVKVSYTWGENTVYRYVTVTVTVQKPFYNLEITTEAGGTVITSTQIVKGNVAGAIRNYSAKLLHNGTTEADIDLSKVVWTCSNETIATVDANGKVSFSGAEGTVQITASYDSGDAILTDTINIYVTKDIYVYPTNGTNDFPEYPNRGAIRFDKTAGAVGTFSETGVAKLELSMTCIPYTTDKLDVVLMLDRSSSMTDDRINATKAAVKVFIKDIVMNEDGSFNGNRIYIGDFLGGHPDYADEPKHAYMSTSYTSNEEDGYQIINDIEEYNELIARIDSTFKRQNSAWGTEYAQSLKYCYDLLNATKDDGNKQFCVFMSDGIPNVFQYGENSKYGNLDDLKVMFTGTSYNTRSSEYHYEYHSTRMKANGVTVFSVGLGLEKANSAWSGAGATDCLNAASLMLNDISGSAGETEPDTGTTLSKKDEFFFSVADANAAADMENAFGRIAQKILEASTNVVVTDKINDEYTMVFGIPQSQYSDHSGAVAEALADEEFYIEFLEYALDANHERTTSTSKLKLYLGVIDNTYYAATAYGSTDGTNKFADPVFTAKTDDVKAYWSMVDDGYTAIAGEIVIKVGSTTYKFIENGSGTHNMTSGAYAYGTIDAATNMSTDLVIVTPYFAYCAETRMLAWTVEKLTTVEYALNYFLYLDNSAADIGEDTETPDGPYPTNDWAYITYTNFNGNDCRQNFPIPQLTWNGARVSFVFYLVNGDGQPINRSGRVVDFANATFVTDVHTEHIVWNDTENVDSDGHTYMDANYKANDLLPGDYTLYDENAYYELQVYEDHTGAALKHYFKIDGSEANGTVSSTTKVYNAKADDKYSAYGTYTKNDVADSFDFGNTTVAFAVVWEPKLVPDTVVVDYGMDVLIDVVRNDLLQNTVHGIGTEKGSTAINSGISTVLKYESALLTIDGNTITIEDENRIRFHQGDMEFRDPVVFYYDSAVSFYEQSEEKSGYLYSSVTVIPATTIYYEDSFVKYSTWNVSDDEPNTDPANQWQTEGTTADKTQAEDRPGGFNLLAVDADNIYGYDGAYTGMTTYSLGSAMKFTANKQVYGEAQFTFWGTGFDLVSLTSNTTGTVTVDVYETDAFNRDGYGADSKTYMVDTYYGYKYVLCDVVYEWDVTPQHRDGHWVKVAATEAAADATELPVEFPDNNAQLKEGDRLTGVEKAWIVDKDANDALYQVPVMKVTGLPYKQYTVIVTVYYRTGLDHQNQDGKNEFDFYMDAIRIYDPANDGKDNPVIEDAYVADGEGWPSYYELRNLILDADTFDSLNEEDEISGIVYIDGNTSLGGKAAIRDYTNFGPNNELYLGMGQGISFTLPDDDNIDQIHLAMKTLLGSVSSAEVKVFAAGKDINEVEAIQLTSATDLYYDISDLKGKTIVIYNASDAAEDLISITNIKITHTAKPTSSDDGSPFQITKRGATMALQSVNSSLPEISDPKATVVSKWNIVLGDDIGANFYVEAPKENAAMAAVKVTVAGQTENYDLSALTPNEEGLYKISVNVAAAQMTEDITLQMVVDGEEYTAVSYTIQDYAETILAGEYSQQTKNLVKHMLNYGAAAQNYFGVNKENLANAGNEIAYTAQYPAEYPQLAVNGKISGIRFYGASLVFESKVALRYYVEANSIEGVTFSVNGINYPAVEKNGKFYVEVPGIAPSAYADSVVLSVQKDGQQLEVSYSPLTYIVRMSQKGQSELNALMNAMYGYYEAAIAYEQQADQ